MARAFHAFLAYGVISLAATWPLARGLGQDVAWDLGDPVLNMWILAWDCEQIRRILMGDLSSIATFFDANIFYPVPLALAYSEHLVPQAIQILPVYLISDNPILCYNLLFLSTFALSGLGMYLLVRELTGSPLAAFVAGLLFGFAPYRLAQSSHLQVLSSQWMPFVFYGLARYFGAARQADPSAGSREPARRTWRLRPLAGAAGALAVQGLSSGYYLLFFTPFAAAFVLWEVGRARLWREGRMWLQLSGAALLVAAVTVPFLLPYAALSAQGSASRPLVEASRLSADVYSYATAFSEQRVWGHAMQLFPRPEGELFPGAVPLLLALVGIAVWREPRRDRAAGGPEPAPQAHGYGPRWLPGLLVAVAVGHGVAAALTLVRRQMRIDAGLFTVSIRDIDLLLLRAAAALALLAVVSPAARARLGLFLRHRGFFVLGLGAALWLSLGPAPHSLGRPLNLAAPYRVLFDYVPGFDGARVPARFAMIAVVMLSVLAGFGAQALARYRHGRRALILLSAAFLIEATHVPFILNGMTELRDHNLPEARLYRPSRAPAIYRTMAEQGSDSVVVELPLGPTVYDVRAMYYSIVHGRPVVNGYSGFLPRHYGRLVVALEEIPRHADLSRQMLRASGATHVILHEAAYRNGEGAATAAVLRQGGAVEVFREGADALFLLPR